MKKYVLLLLLVLINYISTFSQTWPADTIHPRINTGDPQFPFPQFLEYKAGKTLATNNAEGVTHADMEKTMREAYEIMMHRCLYVPGKTLKGKKYIIYNHNSVPFNNNTFVSEGDGYALLAAAYFADKEAFDGLWLWIHDNRLSKVKKYYDCSDLRANYPHGPYLAGWKSDENTPLTSTDINSATDGDYDIAMGLLIAAAQWPNGMGITDGCGNAINYKDEALKVMKALVDTVYYTQNYKGDAAGGKGYLTGDIGVDGYCKNGNTWGEVTDWRYLNPNAPAWAKVKPDPIQVKSLYTDYIGPAYFHEFAKYLTTNGGTEWQINQFKRGEASSDWLIGQMYAKGYIASSGNCTVSDDGSATTFGPHGEAAGEDFRASWRTILNYVWHGNPDSKWDPAAHAVVPGANTYESDMGKRHANFLKFPRTLPSDDSQANCQTLGASPDPSCPDYKGVVNIKQGHTVLGAEGSGGNYRTNYNVGTGASAAVASEDLELIAEIYRQSELLWDGSDPENKDATDDERYIRDTPKYFHDWFRVLGLLTTSGNLHPYGTMTPSANLKVYMSVDKTYAYAGDLITYTISYRNYGTIDAAGISIKTTLGSEYDFVSATNGGVFSGGGISWSLGSLPGFKSTTGIAPTKGLVKFTVRVKNITEKSRQCLVSTISNTTNALTWTSNEYPNNASYTMERNCVDLLTDRSLKITKTTDRANMNPGDIANFKLEFENITSADLWLNGGRNKVAMSYGNYLADRTFYQYYRFWHTAEEAYVNLHNYRVSYYMNDPVAVGLYNATTNPTGWAYDLDNENDMNKYGYNPTTLPADERISFSHQEIPFGSNSEGSWNQRIIIRFANVLTSPTTHIYDKLDNRYLIHKGAIGPAFFRNRLESKPSSLLAPRLADDWSYSKTIDINDPSGGQSKRLTPITNNWADPNNPDQPVTTYSKDACEYNVPNYKKLLVEEFDGYTWRRLAGNSPLPGREAYNVQVVDTIPKELTWNGFTDSLAIGVTATYTPAPAGAAYSGIVKWTIPVMFTGTKGDLTYKAIAGSTPPCPTPDRKFVNIGYIFSPTDSPDTSKVALKITCNAVPPTKPIETSLHKTADKTSVVEGDVVTYTLDFKNVDGATATWSSTGSLSDWQVMGTGPMLPDLNKAVISLDDNNNANKPGTKGYSFGNKKSHGINGYIEATIAGSNSSQLSFIYRHSAGTPGSADFKGVQLKITPNPGGDNTINFDIYNDAVLLISLKDISYKGNARAIKIKTELIDDKLYIWTGDFTGAPLKIITGITQLNAGYVGVFATGSQQTISSYKTHFDSAFDLVVSDPVPSQLGNITAISPAADNVTAGIITWPKIPGPIPAGSSNIYTFKATVNTCADFITNIAHAAIYGNPDIASQFVVNCKNTSCTPPVITSLNKNSICSGAPLDYTITSDIPTATFTWSRAAVTGISNAAVTGQTSNSIKETLVNTGTTPIDVKYVVIAEDATCAAEPWEYTVTVNPALEMLSSKTGTVCSSSPQNYDINSNIATATFTWSRAAVAGISNPAVTGQTADPITETLINTTTSPIDVKYIITPTAAGCTPVPFEYVVTVNFGPTITSDAEGGICSGAPQNYDIKSADAAATFTWSRAAVAGVSNPAVTDQTADPITETLTNTGTAPVTVQYIITPTSGTCKGTPFNYDVTVTNSLAITSDKTDTTCSGTPLSYDLTSNISTATFTWSRAAVAGISNPAATGQTSDPIAETLINTTSTPIVVEYSIAATAPGCPGVTDFIYQATVIPSPEISIPAAGSICSGSPHTFDIISTTSTATFTWSRAAVTGISNAAVTNQTTDPITETLINTSTNPVVAQYVIVPSAGMCKGTPVEYNLTVNPASMVTSPASDTICTGTPQNYDITSNLSSATFTWSREAVNGISNPAVADQTADPITETLINTGASPVKVKYNIVPSGAGCPGIPFTYEVTISPVPSITSVLAGTACGGVAQNYDITSDISIATFIWSRAAVAGISNPGVTAQSSDPIKEILINTGSDPAVATYVIVPAIGSCAGTPVNYQVTVAPSAVIKTQPSSVNICGGGPLNLMVEATGDNLTYQWKFNGTNISGATSKEYNLPSTTSANTGKYTVDIQSGCGTVASEVANVLVSSAPSTNLGVSGSKICQGDNGTITIANSENGVSYEAFIGDGSVSSSQKGNGGNLVLNVSASALLLGNNVISVHADGCSKTILTSNGEIQVTAVPEADAGIDIQLEDYTQTTLDGKGSSQGAYTYLWTSSDPAAVISNPAAITTAVLPKITSTDFTLTVSDRTNTNCKATDAVNVKVALKPLFVPDAFSPNGDGTHDVFEIPNIKNYPLAVLYVYNQWGELIYKSSPGYTVLWDGTRNGTPVPVSAYYYILELNDGTPNMSGSITILK